MKNYNYLFFFLILALAVFFRFWQLDSIPPGLYPDVAINGNEALTNPGHVFYPENNGREGLMMNLIALSFALFGVSVWSIKAVAATFGTLTVLGTYLFCMELFSSVRQFASSSEFSAGKNSRVPQTEFPSAIPLIASFFLAISFWHVNFSRFGFRAILLPFILVFAFYFFFRGIRTKKILDFILAGIIFGLGFYTYSSFRMAVLLLPILLIYFFFISIRERRLKKFLLFSFSFLTVIFAVALPIGLYFLSHPADFASRAAPISVFAQENPIKAFGESLVRHLVMLNIYGDPNWRHNYPGSPQLLWPIGILFLIGVIVSLYKITKDLRIASRDRFLSPYIFLFAWFFIMLLPGALTYEGMPHSLRTIGVIPVPYIFAAVGGWNLWQWICQKNVHKKLLIFFAVFFLAMVAFAEYNKYFILWGQNKETEGAFTKSYVDVGNYLNSLPEETKKYVIVNEPGVPIPLPGGLPMPAQTPMFIESTKYGKPQTIYLKPEELDQIFPAPNMIIVSMKNDEILFQTLLKKLPQGQIIKTGNLQAFYVNP